MSGRETLTASLPPTLTFRVERIEYADIEVDVAALIEEWKDDDTTPWAREDIVDVLRKIGVQDLLYSGDFIRVLDRDTEESIR